MGLDCVTVIQVRLQKTNRANTRCMHNKGVALLEQKIRHISTQSREHIILPDQKHDHPNKDRENVDPYVSEVAAHLGWDLETEIL